MSTENQLVAQARDRVGKGAARELRRNSMVPAVIYGDKKPPLAIALPFKEISMKINAGGFLTNILTIEVDGAKHQVLPKDFQLDKIRDFVTHVDLLRVSSKTVVTVEIPVHFENEDDCPGLKAGGVLNIVRHAVEVVCPANEIPEYFTIDLLPFALGDSINVSSVTMSENVTPTITDRDFTIATIASPAGLKSEDDANEDGAETAAEGVEATDADAADGGTEE